MPPHSYNRLILPEIANTYASIPFPFSIEMLSTTWKCKYKANHIPLHFTLLYRHEWRRFYRQNLSHRLQSSSRSVPRFPSRKLFNFLSPIPKFHSIHRGSSRKLTEIHWSQFLVSIHQHARDTLAEQRHQNVGKATRMYTNAASQTRSQVRIGGMKS